MTILITGIAGFLGSRFAEWLLHHVADGRVIGVDDLSCGYAENVPPGAEWLQMPLGFGHREVEAWIRKRRPEYIFHCAAYAAEGLSPFIRCYNYRNNLLATAELINLAIELESVRRFVFTSSMATYGRGDSPFAEETICRPIDPYGVAKAACENDVRIAGEQHGLDWCIIRPHNVYGPGQSIWQKYRNVLGNWMARHIENKPLLVYGDGGQRRAFSFIDDCLPCLWRAATAPVASRETINLGGTQPVTIRGAAEMVCDAMGGGEIVHVESRHEVRDAWCTWEKSVHLLDYRERTSLEEGIRRMWTWARHAWDQFPERRGTHQVADLEVRRGLYSYWR